jgi:hypothetical protein
MLNVLRPVIATTVKNDLKLKPYQQQIFYALIDAQKAARLQKCQPFLGGILVVFSYVKLCLLQATHNQQNDKILSKVEFR